MLGCLILMGRLPFFSAFVLPHNLIPGVETFHRIEAPSLSLCL